MYYLKTDRKDHSFTIVNQDLFHSIENVVNNGVSVIVPHVCNNIDSFGAGFAGAVAQKYPIVKENYHLLGQSFLKKNPGYAQFITVFENQHHHKLIFCNMIAQNGVISHKNPRPLNYLSLCRSMLMVSNYIRNANNDPQIQIHAPRFGSQLAGGNWNFISDLIDDIWGDFTVFIYDNRRPKDRS